MENITLDIKSLSKSYGLIKALNDVSFSLAEGEYASLLGPNGAGKTTLFQILTGLFVSEKGNVLINDFDMRSNAINALAHIGVVFQQITLDMDLTVMENLKRVIIELEQVNLSDRINDKVRSLSGGQKRRVELARSLLHKPKLLLLDEPTVGLDPQSRRDLLDYVIKLKKERKMAVLWATHLVDEAEKSDTVIILNKGKIIKKDTPQNITKEYNKDTLHDAFVSLTS